VAAELYGKLSIGRKFKDTFLSSKRGYSKRLRQAVSLKMEQSN
jgi:hypothetical protein